MIHTPARDHALNERFQGCLSPRRVRGGPCLARSLVLVLIAVRAGGGVAPRRPLEGSGACSPRLLRGHRQGASILLDPFPTESDGFFRREPGPIGAARADRDPYGFAVDMLFDRERRGLRH